MVQEKETFVPVNVVSEDLKVDADTLYSKVLGICRLEANPEKYDEQVVAHFQNVHRCVQVSLKGEEKRFFVDTFEFLREDEGIMLTILLRDIPEVEGVDSGEDLLEGLDIFQGFKNELLMDCEPTARMNLKIPGVNSYQDNFFSFYPVYLQVSDSERVQEIEDIVSRIEDREVVPV
jgi:hypothetical protein